MPNAWHHLFQAPYQDAHAESRLAAPASVTRKRPDLRVDVLLNAAPPGLLGPDIEIVPIAGAPAEESVFLQRPSKTLFTSDLAIAVDGTFPMAPQLYGRVAGIHGRYGVSRALRRLYPDGAAAARAITDLLDRDFERIVPAHGPILETDGKARLHDAVAWLLAPRGEG